MFFMVSGYFYREKTIPDRIKHNCKSLLVPYLVNGFCYYLIWLIRNPTDFSLKHVVTLLSGLGTSPITGAVQWFLSAMFFADIIYAVLNKAIKNQIARTCAVLVLAILGMGIPQITEYVPWAIPAAMASLVFYHLGSWIRNIENKNKVPIGDMVQPWHLMISVFALAATIMINGSVNMRTGEYRCWPLFLLNAAGGCTAIWIICFKLEKFLSRYVQFSKRIEKRTAIGRNSIIYLCANQMVISVCSGIVLRLSMNIKSDFGDILRKLAIIFLTFIVLRIVEMIVMNTRLKILFGK